MNFFQQFLACFPAEGERRPDEKESRGLEISRDLGLKRPSGLHTASWAIGRLLRAARTRPAHDVIMGYIEDIGLYDFLLGTYKREGVLRIRDLRALVSFVNMIKQSSLSDPSYGLDDLIDELNLR